MKEKRS